jgi:hypothetical protein
VNRVLLGLREIATEALQSAWKSKQNEHSFHILKRVLRAFHEMSTSKNATCRGSLEVPKELLSLLHEWENIVSSAVGDAAKADLGIMVDFMISESAPSDVLGALEQWSSTTNLGTGLYPRLESLLRNGAQLALESETSSSLLRLQHIRSSYHEENAPLATRIGSGPDGKYNNDSQVGIWKQMTLGGLVIDK